MNSENMRVSSIYLHDDAMQVVKFPLLRDEPLHLHPYWELTLFNRSKGVTCINGNHIFKINSSQVVFLLPPNMLHGYYLNHKITTSATVTKIIFPNDLLNNNLLNKLSFLSLKKLFLKACGGLAFNNISSKQMMEYFSIIGHSNDFLDIIYLLKLLHTLTKEKSYRVLNETHSIISNENNTAINAEAINTCINKHFQEDICLKKISLLFNVSEATFARYCKMHTGKSFTELVIEKRIGHAIQLLAHHQKTIKDVAFSCGFNNVTHFNRIFKMHTGLAPKNYQLLLQTNIPA
jgi:AraC-like DNA-binding protein